MLLLLLLDHYKNELIGRRILIRYSIVPINTLLDEYIGHFPFITGATSFPTEFTKSLSHIYPFPNNTVLVPCGLHN